MLQAVLHAVLHAVLLCFSFHGEAVASLGTIGSSMQSGLHTLKYRADVSSVLDSC